MMNDLPQFFGQLQPILTVFRDELVAVNFEVLPISAGSQHAVGELQPDRSRPQAVGEELKLLAVPTIEIRARALELLLHADRLTRLRGEPMLGHAVRPQDAHRVRLGESGITARRLERARFELSAAIQGAARRLLAAREAELLPRLERGELSADDAVKELLEGAQL